MAGMQGADQYIRSSSGFGMLPKDKDQGSQTSNLTIISQGSLQYKDWKEVELKLNPTEHHIRYICEG